MVKVACCLPLDWEWMPKNFAISLLGMQSHAYRSGEYELEFYYGRYINFGRQRLAETVLKQEIDYVFWVDADQVYPEDSISILLKHDKEIVGGLTGKRTNASPLTWMFTTKEEEKQFPEGMAPRLRQLQTKAHTGLQKCECMGMGGILTKIDVFKKLPPPWFQTIYLDAIESKRGGDSIGEDVYFYEKAKNVCIEVWCDTDLVYGHLATRMVVPK